MIVTASMSNDAVDALALVVGNCAPRGTQASDVIVAIVAIVV